uniref:Uncharacterized protein n=1 Tax=Arundo donax TaxID=35708 RepID=A0A0A9AQ68_ARUDO
MQLTLHIVLYQLDLVDPKLHL